MQVYVENKQGKEKLLGEANELACVFELINEYLSSHSFSCENRRVIVDVDNNRVQITTSSCDETFYAYDLNENIKRIIK